LGAWKKAYAAGKSVPATMMVFLGCPLSQTIYGMLLMFAIAGAVNANPANWAAYMGAGIFGGLGIGACSWFQAIICASAIDTVCETGKGFPNGLIAMGVAETISLFVLVFMMLQIG
jgi:V/A-type H+-transporting ATPase subunit K